MSVCSCTVEQGVQSVADIANSVSTADSKEVKSIKDSYLTQYSSTITVGQAIDSFLGDAMWQYFSGSGGEKVVQCNGTCVYDNNTVEAKIQFILNDDNTFEVGALAFNDISQNLLMTAAFLSKAYESAGGSANNQTSTQTNISGTINGKTDNSTVSNNSSAGSSQDKDVEIGDVDPKTQRIGIFESIEDYLNEYRLDGQVLTGAEVAGLDQLDTRFLINALYAYHGYTFESEDFRRFYGRKAWYTPSGKSMDACEAEFNSSERANKQLLVDHEKAMGWR